MTAINIQIKTATALLVCRKCGQQWQSRLFGHDRWGDEVRACRPAFDAGWRIFYGGRSQYAYCPDHGPSVEMRLLYPSGRYDE